MRTKDFVKILETWAPSSIQESYDNSGLLVGSGDKIITKILIALDCTEEVIDEAIAKNCDFIVAHHPIIFGGIKRLNGNNYVENVILKAIRNDISIYAIHTNLDNISTGVNSIIADKLSLRNTKILRPKRQLLKKLVTYIPKEYKEAVSSKIFEVGAGNIGNYSQCGFSIEGTGTFLGNEHSIPFLGSQNNLENIYETRFETIFPSYLEHQVLTALKASHPYEEVAYDIFPLDTNHPEIGSGLIGELETEMKFTEFLALVKNKFHLEVIKHAGVEKSVKKVAVCGGSGSFLRQDAIKNGADIFLSSDFKYHEWFDHENKISFIDIGHYESEQFTPELIFNYLEKNKLSLPAQISAIITNPVKYYL